LHLNVTSTCLLLQSFISESTLGGLLNFLLGDPAPLPTLLTFNDDGSLDDSTTIVILFPSGGCSRSQDTPSPEPSGSEEDTCIKVFNGGGLFDKESSQDASFGSAAIPVYDQNKYQISEMPKRRTGV
jgi:hypothetical protein